MTTGQPIKVPSDRNKYDNEFMENLRLQIKLNDANLQANRLYQNTGQLPPSVQMADTRTTAEKLADIEGLKRSIVADLSPIAETSFAFAIINGVLNSPLNIDNTLFRYLAQNAPMFAQQLSKKYKFGISGNANDVALIVQFLEDAYSQTSDKFQSIKNYINSSSNINNNVSLQDTLIREFSDWTWKLEDIQRRSQGMATGTNRIVLNRLKEMIAKIRFYLPTTAQMETIMKESTYFNLSDQEKRDLEYTGFNTINPGVQPLARQDIIRDMAEIIRKLPSIQRVKTLINLINKAIVNNSVQSFDNGVFNLLNLFEDWVLPDNGRLTQAQETIRDFRQAFLAPLNAQMRDDEINNRINTIDRIEAMNAAQERDAKAQRVYVINPDTDPVKVSNGVLQRESNPDLTEQNLLSSTVGNPSRNYQQSEQSYYNPIAQSEYSSSTGNPSSKYSEVAEGYRQQFGLDSTRSPSLASSFGYEDQYPIIYPDTGEEFGYLGENPISKEVLSGYPKKRISGNPIYTYEEMKQNLQNAKYTKQQAFIELSKQFPSEIINDSEFDDMRPQKKSSSLPSSGQLDKKFIDLLQFHHGEIDKGKDSGALNPDEARELKIDVARIIQLASTNGYDDNKTDREIVDYINKYITEKRMKGHGIRKLKKGRGLSSDYREFGINKINHKKLDDGILTLRRGSNSNIPDMPSKRISRKLQKIIKHISGGGMPDFNDINNLEDNEKDYLHKLISKSNLTDRLSVPAPSKDQEEKDFHQFEVMKGEIMSGNDSQELVKKFKVLILKLSKQNVLPKNEVQELLQDLLSLGY